MLNAPPDTEALRTLLERLFPDVDISATGVALLAAQIADLEDRCKLLHSRLDHKFTGKAGLRMTRIHHPVPHMSNRERAYRPAHHAR